MSVLQSVCFSVSLTFSLSLFRCEQRVERPAGESRGAGSEEPAGVRWSGWELRHPASSATRLVPPQASVPRVGSARPPRPSLAVVSCERQGPKWGPSFCARTCGSLVDN